MVRSKTKKREKKTAITHRFFCCLGLTIERIYYWLNESEDEQFLLCLLSLLRNLLDEKDTEILLSQFNETTLLKVSEENRMLDVWSRHSIKFFFFEYLDIRKTS